MNALLPVLPCLVLWVSAQASAEAAPGYAGDPEAELLLGTWLSGAMRGTEAFGPWPEGSWTVQLHESDASFERATGSPAGRFALWIDSTLHLRPWPKLQQRDLGALLRHELTHRRLAAQALPRWKEEAICLWAENHTRPPLAWPLEPDEALQRSLDRALEAGTTAYQHWAYSWLRAWIGGKPLPERVVPPASLPDGWRPETSLVRVVWPPERLPHRISVNGQDYLWKPSAHFHFEGQIRFGPSLPISYLEGAVDLQASPAGWRLLWSTTPQAWTAAAVEGELGREAPFEAKRALAVVLRAWLEGHPQGNHPDGTFCPLTHCAVIRGQGTPEGQQAVAKAPDFPLPPDLAFFTGSNGGVAWSPREAWGKGTARSGQAQVVPGDPWGTWTRHLSPAQVRTLKASVSPGLAPGQRGLHLGASGPYAVESLRLEAGRRFGWTLWPSNACEAEARPDGSIDLHGHGWGHNVGLSLAAVVSEAKAGKRAEEILREAFPDVAP
jgi:hypothetical protein